MLLKITQLSIKGHELYEKVSGLRKIDKLLVKVSGWWVIYAKALNPFPCTIYHKVISPRIAHSSYFNVQCTFSPISLLIV